MLVKMFKIIKSGVCPIFFVQNLSCSSLHYVKDAWVFHPLFSVHTDLGFDVTWFNTGGAFDKQDNPV